MADIKRVNYFTHQFLVEKDFDDEQTYHIDMRRRHNRVYHSWGVAEGLDVSKTADKEVTISSGTAINKHGQEIVLESRKFNLTAFGSNAKVYLTIAYQEVFDEADHYTSGGVDNYTRTTERPEIEGKTAVPPGDGSVITLARVHLDGSGNVVEIANSVRTLVGSKIAPGVVNTNELADGAVTEQKLANNAVSNRTIQDNAITHHKIVDGNVRSAELANNAAISAKIAEADGTTGQNANTGRGVKTGHLQNAAITGAKIADNTIIETKLNKATRAKLVTNGNSHDHSGGDGAQIRHSTLGMNDGRNPHGTRAADIDKQDGRYRIVAQINAGAGVIDKKNIDPAAGLRGWVRLPFLPMKCGERTEFMHVSFFSKSGPEGATGTMEIPAPPGATRVKNFRIAGTINDRGITVRFYIIELYSVKESFKFLIEGAPFDELFIIDRTINAETGCIVVEVEAYQTSSIWFVASQFE